MFNTGKLVQQLSPHFTFSATRDTISMCKKMADAGAKAVLVVTPCFYKGMMTNDLLVSHFTKVLYTNIDLKL